MRDGLQTIDEQIVFCKQTITASRMLLDGFPQRESDLVLEIKTLTERLDWLRNAYQNAPADIERKRVELSNLHLTKSAMTAGGGSDLGAGKRRQLERKKERFDKKLAQCAALMQELREGGVDIESLRPGQGD